MLGPCVIICQLSFPPHMTTTSIHHAGRANLSHARDLQVLDQPPYTRMLFLLDKVNNCKIREVLKYDEIGIMILMMMVSTGCKCVHCSRKRSLVSCWMTIN